MTEISDYATILLFATGGITLAVLSTTLSNRVLVPAPAIFLVAAAIVAELWPDVAEQLPILTVERVAVVALVVILFNGGIDIGWRRFRGSAGPILSLGMFGTFATAGIVAAFAHYALGLEWTIAGILGAALAPTDPAVMFSVLGRREIAGRSGTTLEGEAGVNDPAGIALMLGMIEFATHDEATMLVVVREFAVEMAVGAAAGLAGGWLLLTLLRRLQLAGEGFYPVLALAAAGVLYSLTTVAHGSGFLAVFIAGIVLGDARLPYKHQIEHFHSSLATLAEIVVFVGLGLTVDVGALGAETWTDAALLMLLLAFVARPLVVAATLAGTRLRWNERAFIAWSGLKGAVPILLAAFAILGGVPDASAVYGIVFAVVFLSVAGQGTFVPQVAAALRIPIRERPQWPWQLTVGLEREPTGACEFLVDSGSCADNTELAQLPGGVATLIVRGDTALAPIGSLRLHGGDRVLLIADPEEMPALTQYFQTPDRAQAGAVVR